MRQPSEHHCLGVRREQTESKLYSDVTHIKPVHPEPVNELCDTMDNDSGSLRNWRRETLVSCVDLVFITEASRPHSDTTSL